MKLSSRQNEFMKPQIYTDKHKIRIHDLSKENLSLSGIICSFILKIILKSILLLYLSSLLISHFEFIKSSKLFIAFCRTLFCKNEVQPSNLPVKPKAWLDHL